MKRQKNPKKTRKKPIIASASLNEERINNMIFVLKFGIMADINVVDECKLTSKRTFRTR